MSLFVNWITRFKRKALPRARQPVLAFDRYEQMTATQALRFEELQSTAERELEQMLPDQCEQQWYSLADASDQLSVGESTLLEAAADGRLTCFVYAKRALGQWDKPRQAQEKRPDFLVLPAAHCGELAGSGGSTVRTLELRQPGEAVRSFKLDEPRWVDPQTVYLQHPLPDEKSIGK